MQELTDQEKKLVLEIEKDSLIYRGLPCGVLTAAIDDFVMRRSNPKIFSGRIRLMLGSLNFLTGVAIGRLSYYPVARRRVINELPEDSQLRAKVVKSMRGDDFDVAKINPKREVVTYKDLRERNRSKLNIDQVKDDPQQDDEFARNFPATSVIGYNQYGDPIFKDD